MIADQEHPTARAYEEAKQDAAENPLAAAGGWNETLYRTWYLTGAVWTAGWLGLGPAFLLGRTRFGYRFSLCLFLAGLFTLLIRTPPEHAGSRAPRRAPFASALDWRPLSRAGPRAQQRVLRHAARPGNQRSILDGGE